MVAHIWRTARFLLCVVVALSACDSAPGSAGTFHSDSAGIAIATAIEPLWGPGEGWTVSDEPLLQIGAATGDSEYLLDGVVGVSRLGNGDIVLGEWSTGELGRYDTDGAVVWRTSGKGEGPGEHAYLMFVGSVAGDSVVTFDDGLYRVQVFAPNGRIARTLPVESPWSGFIPSSVIGVPGRQLVMTLDDRRGEIPDGVVRWPGIRVATFSLDDGSMSAVMDVPGAEQMIEKREGGRIAYIGYTFRKGPEFAVRDGRLTLVDTEAFSIRSISLDDGSTSAIFRRDEPIRYILGVWVDDLNVEYVRQYALMK